MRAFIFSLLIIALLACSAGAASAKSLVVVFSRADENYSVGYILKGNTMILAEMIAQKTNSDLFEVKPAVKYAADYDTCIAVAKEEQNKNARPAFLEDKDISEYDTIFLGYPIWWGDLPMCLYTFIEAHNWEGKKIYPFCTHEGSGIGRTESNIKRAMNGAEVFKGLAVRGATAQNNKSSAENSVNNWLKGLGF